MSIKNNTTILEEILEIANALPDAGEGGVELPELENEGTAADLLSGKQLIDGDGNVVTGTILTKIAGHVTASGATVTVPAGYYASQVTKSVSGATQATPSVSIDANGLITASANQTAGYVAAGTKSATKQLTTKAAATITPGTANKIAVAKNVYTTGAITVAGDADLVAGNIKNGVNIFGVAGTYTGEGVNTSDATAAASDIVKGETAYVNNQKLTGTFTVDEELSAQSELIAQIRVAAQDKIGGTTADTLFAKQVITRTIKDLADDSFTTLGTYAFAGCSLLSNVALPNCSFTGSYGFGSCSALTNIYMPNCASIGAYAFANCVALPKIDFPLCTNVHNSAFTGCTALSQVNLPKVSSVYTQTFKNCTSLSQAAFPACRNVLSSAFLGCTTLHTLDLNICSRIYPYAFQNCSALTALTLGSTKVCTLSNSNAFNGTAIAAGTGYIYVPSSLVASYKAATNWTYYSAQIQAIS